MEIHLTVSSSPVFHIVTAQNTALKTQNYYYYYPTIHPSIHPSIHRFIIIIIIIMVYFKQKSPEHNKAMNSKTERQTEYKRT